MPQYSDSDVLICVGFAGLRSQQASRSGNLRAADRQSLPARGPTDDSVSRSRKTTIPRCATSIPATNGTTGAQGFFPAQSHHRHGTPRTGPNSLSRSSSIDAFAFGSRRHALMTSIICGFDPRSWSHRLARPCRETTLARTVRSRPGSGTKRRAT